jgi:tetratricopeptide (TPR) repeat protein
MRAALAARDQGDPEAGLALLELHQGQHEGSAGFWQVKGLLHRHLQNSAPALAALNKAHRLSPSDVRILHALARVTLEAGLPALSLFEAALRLAPSDGDLWIGRSAALLAEGRDDEAIRSLLPVVRSSPAWLDGQRALAQFRWLRGERRFTAALDEFVRANPQAESAWLLRIDLLMQAGEYESALEVIQGARSLHCRSETLDVFEASTLSELADPRAGAIFARLSASRDPAVVARHLRYLLRSGQADEAAQRGEACIHSEGADQIWPYLSLAWRLIHHPKHAWLDGDPRLIGVYDLTADLPPLDRLSALLRDLHLKMAAPLGQSVRGGSQTDGPLFARIDPEIREARAAIEHAVRRHAAGLAELDRDHPTFRPLSGKPPRFAGSWSVRLLSGGQHTSHIHPQGWISSALYVEVPSSSEAGAAPAGWLTVGNSPAELGLDLPALRTFKPVPGQLVLFPSTMWHGTVPTAGGERITIAFDIAA